MVVGIVRIELHIPASRSLKDKRHVVRGLKDRIRERVHAAVAEVDHHDLWQRAALGVAVVAAEGGQVRELLQSVRSLVDHVYEAQIIDWQERIE
jgi:hypothetical protein